MDEPKVRDERESVSYLYFESALTKMETVIKRQWVVILVILLLWFGTIGVYEYKESQYEILDTEVTYTQDGEGTNVIGAGNEVLYGTAVSHTD